MTRSIAFATRLAPSHLRTAIHTLLFVIGTLGISQAALANPVFNESGGIVMMEVESVGTQGRWVRESSIGGYRGSAYYVWRGEQYFNPASAGRGTIRYHFRINSPGNYQMRWRSRIAHGSIGSEHNDTWIRFPTGSNINGQHGLNGWTKVYMGHLNTWSWDSYTVDHVGKQIRQYFSAGDHYLEISGRSYGHAVDRISLFKYDGVDFSPSRFDQLPESSRVGAQPPTPAPVVEPPAPPEPVVEPVAEPVVEEPVVTVTQDSSTAVIEAPVLTRVDVYSTTAAEVFWGRGDATIVSYDIFLNGDYLDSSSGTSYFLDGLASGGNYTLSIRSIAANGDASPDSTIDFETQAGGSSDTVGTTAPDTVPADAAGGSGPEAPADASLTVYSETAAELFWARAPEEQNIVGTDIYRDGVYLASTNGTSFFDDTRNPGQQYQYRLVAVDATGNYSSPAEFSE